MKLPKQIEILKTFSTCDIVDALQSLGVENGGYVPDIDMLSPGYKEDGVIAAPA